MAQKILVVDDDLDTLRLVGLMLERQGFSILAAPSGRQALTIAKAEKPVMILLDLMMPDIDGLEVARRLRADPDTQHIFIIMFTAKTQMEDKLVGFEAGADAYLTKPIQPRELIANVKAVLQRADARQAALAGPPAVQSYKKRGEIIAVISTKGGVGVTTMALNLAVQVQRLSKKPVLIADFRPGCGGLAQEMGFTDAKGMNHLLELNPGAIIPEVIERELVDHPSGLRFLLSSPHPADASHSNDIECFDAIVRNMAFLAPNCVLDLGVSLTPVNRKVLESVHQVVLVFEPTTPNAQQARLLFDVMVEAGVSADAITLALVNRQRAGMQLSLGQVQDAMGMLVTMVFTAAAELAYQAQLTHTPMVLRQPDGVTSQQFNGLAQRVLQKAAH